MFERYTESARRVLFFARYEASQKGSPAIETEHMLHGLLREDKGIVRRVLRESKIEPASLRQQYEQRAVFYEKVSTSREIPFSPAAKAVLQFAAEEADRLEHSHIGSEHILLALLRKEGTVAASILANHGLGIEGARATIVSVLAKPLPMTPEARSEVASLAGRIKQWADELARAQDEPEAEALARRIQEGVDGLRRLLGES